MSNAMGPFMNGLSLYRHPETERIDDGERGRDVSPRPP